MACGAMQCTKVKKVASMSHPNCFRLRAIFNAIDTLVRGKSIHQAQQVRFPRALRKVDPYLAAPKLHTEETRVL
jgi:hypothetical protein